MEENNQQSSGLDIKEIIKGEIKKCKADFIYFIKKYFWIKTPDDGRMVMDLFPYQEKVIKLFVNGKWYIIDKSRQIGISTLVGGYALWLILFHADKNILVIANKQDTAKGMVTKVTFGYENLPTWLKITKVNKSNALSLELDNGSNIKAVSSATDSGRSEAVSLLIIDEAAFIDKADTIALAAMNSLGKKSQCIAISTPNGVGNWFHKSFTKAELGEGKFQPIKLPWYVHPGRDQAWRDEQDIEFGKLAAAQEHDCLGGESEVEILDTFTNEIKRISLDELYSYL